MMSRWWHRRCSGLWRVGWDEEFDAAVRAFHQSLADDLADAAAVRAFVAADIRRVLRVKYSFLPVDESAEQALVDEFKYRILDLLLRHLHFDGDAAKRDLARGLNHAEQALFLLYVYHLCGFAASADEEERADASENQERDDAEETNAEDRARSLDLIRSNAGPDEQTCDAADRDSRGNQDNSDCFAHETPKLSIGN